MTSQLQNLQQQYFEMLNSIPFVEEDLDYSVLEKHTPHLEELDRLGKSAVSVFDMYRKTHVYISPSYRKRLGLPDDRQEGPEGFDQLMHPEDRLMVNRAGCYFLKIALGMDDGKLRDFKLMNDYRICRSGVFRRDLEGEGKGTEDNWIRMTEQHRILETDPHGNLWLSLSVVDISPDQKPDSPMRSRLINQETGELFIFPENGENSAGAVNLSAREIEILKLISVGQISKQIAGELFISVHTVNTHRQNIIEKMQVANTAEAVRYAARLGIL